MLRGLEHLPCEERLWDWGGWSWLRDGFGSANSVVTDKVNKYENKWANILDA